MSSTPGNPSPWSVEDTGGEEKGEATFRDYESSDEFLWPEDVSEKESGRDIMGGATDHSGGKGSLAETAWMFKLRRNLDQLDSIHGQTAQDVLQAREQLKLCRQNIADMEKQRGKLEKEVERSSEPGSSAAMAFRLRARLQSACRELHQEELLESHISTALRAKELELNQLEVELGRLSHLRQEVQDKEQAFLAVKGQKTQARLLRATQEANTLRRRRRAQAAAQQKEEAQRQQLADQSPAIHQAAAKCLKQSSKRSQSDASRPRAGAWRSMYSRENMKHEVPLSTATNKLIE